MALPAELVLVRHGESEGNVANAAARRGNFEHHSEEFRSRETHAYRLTELGIEQARSSGEWIAEHIGPQFDRYYTSYYSRAQETAGQLGLPGAEWYINPFLHERRLGTLSDLPPEELQSSEDFARRDESPLFWKPPGGESVLEVAFRFDRILQTLHRECDGGRAILVNHGDVMTAARVVLERMDEFTFTKWKASDDPGDHIHNGQIIHYTRRTDPENPNSSLADSLMFRRSICPWDMSLSTNEWEEIIRPRYKNEEMLEAVEYYPRLVNRK